METAMTKQESYVQRRQLFKDIWETAMHIDERETDIMNKPKVVKTLRMAEIDKCPIGRTKKQRIKNLRHVCNRILDFCDKQEADDTLYEKIATEANHPEPIKSETNQKKLKKIRHRRKIIKAKSLFTPKTTSTVARATTSSVKDPDPLSDDGNNVSRQRSPLKKKASIELLKETMSVSGAIKTKTTTTRSPNELCPKAEGYPREAPAHRRRTVKKRRFKKKKLSVTK